MFQHLLWYFGHPEVYLSLLPFLLAFGLAIFIVWKRRIKEHAIALLFVLSAFASALAGLKVGHSMYSAGIDTALHDTYYVIAHLQWVGMLAVSFIVFALAYFLFRRFAGVPYRRSLAAMHWGLYSVGIALIYAPTLLLIGDQGMPRRYADYEQSFETWNRVSHIGYIVTLISVGIFAICLIEGISRRIRYGKEPDA